MPRLQRLRQPCALQRIQHSALLLAVLVLVACSDSSDGTSDSASASIQPAAPEAPVLEPTVFEEAQLDFVENTISNGSGGTYGGLVHVSEGMAPPEGSFDRALEKMNMRDDTSDFNLPGLMMLLYRYADSEGLDPSKREEIVTEILRFKYWPDELEAVPDTTDVQNMVTWTENHYILFTSGAFLAGQLYPEEVFAASGRTGEEQMAAYRPRILKWLELRYRSGFSEWLSNVYYNEDMPALLALIELADDEEIVEKSKIVLDLMFADLALNHFRGNFGATHGRTYTGKMNGNRDSTRGAMHLAFDLHSQATGNMTATMLALSENYQVPEVLNRIANDVDTPEMENRQRMGIKLEEAAQWGLSLGRFEDGMCFLTMEPYPHPLFIDLFYDMLNAYDWWGHRDFEPFNEYRFILDNPESRAAAAEAFEWDITRNMRPEVNIYTYRTPSYMLSTAQDWRKGFGGDQSSIWQATLGMEAVAFTTHPANENTSGPTPNYWVGYGTLPRAAQIKNVVASLYDVDTRDGLYYSNQPLYTHAFLPRAEFDETLKESGWFFARTGDAYLALWSSDPEANWVPNTDPDEHGGQDYEIIANGEKTVWILELGDADHYGDFAAFRAAIADAAITADVNALTVSYDSPTQGTIDMGWEGPVLNDGVEVQLDGYGRYQNPWSDSAFPAEEISFTHGDSFLHLDFATMRREFSQ
ncbi:MAG: hypothetical protein AAGF46_06820 [Pseudomonadota bacterium]